MPVNHEKQKLLTAEKLRELLDYDPVSGVFRWRVKPNKSIAAGAEAGSVSGDGYLRIVIGRVTYYCNRLAVLYMTGEWPAGVVDHRDGNTLSNAWLNHRDTSQGINQQNRHRASSRSKTGLLGVVVCGNAFQAFIREPGRPGEPGKQRYLGRYRTAEEAHSVYLAAKRQMHAGCTI
jgi:hypothetical protein